MDLSCLSNKFYLGPRQVALLLGREDLLEKEKKISQYSCLRIPWTEKPGRQSLELQRVRCN